MIREARGGPKGKLLTLEVLLWLKPCLMLVSEVRWDRRQASVAQLSIRSPFLLLHSIPSSFFTSKFLHFQVSPPPSFFTFKFLHLQVRLPILPSPRRINGKTESMGAELVRLLSHYMHEGDGTVYASVHATDHIIHSLYT
ncbi:hypothetical protein E6O75_ATG07488 [Venturia nashicola]|uniref:Uncharacterized protein n=1 Tax=Venturia nashicola TaxID=86259 RepID=A0A4Z1PEY4_9PEZI|nr:hypothetical protein E6O75_ATG07488 [Venturia nashicola]